MNPCSFLLQDFSGFAQPLSEFLKLFIGFGRNDGDLRFDNAFDDVGHDQLSSQQRGDQT